MAAAQEQMEVDEVQGIENLNLPSVPIKQNTKIAI